MRKVTGFLAVLLAVSLGESACQSLPQASDPSQIQSRRAALTPTLEISLPPLPAASPTPVPVAPSPFGSPTPEPSLAPDVPALLGFVTAPAAIVSNNGGGILANNSANIIGSNAASFISDKGGSIIGNNGSSYRVLADSSTSPLVNAFLYLTDRDEKYFFNSQTNNIFTATTDSQGAFTFPITTQNGFPVGKDVIVNALLNNDQRLTGYLVPKNGRNELKLDLASTLATEYLRGQAYSAGKALGSYDATAFYNVVNLTEQAIDGAEIPVSTTALNASGTAVPVSAFDLQLSGLDVLRNQYCLAISVAKKSDTLMHSLSDAWKQLLGHRPMAVTTVAGNGQLPTVAFAPDPPNATGDWRNGKQTPPQQVPLGWIKQIAVAKRGDVFVSAQGPDLYNGYVRWFKPDGSITSLWNAGNKYPELDGLLVENEPTDDSNHPGSLIVATGQTDLILRLPIVSDEALDANGKPKFPIQYVTGDFDNLDADPASPVAVDGQTNHPLPDGATPKTSYWQIADEGQPNYVTTGQPIPNPAKYAHIGAVYDLAYDDLHNIYLSDAATHRVCMIVSPQGDGRNYYGYRQPIDSNGDGIIDSFGATVTMHAGCIYTIAGDPSWDPAHTGTSSWGCWFGDYAGDGGPAQQAKLDTPRGLAFYNGALYVCDSDNQRVRRLDRTTGIITSVAGDPPGPQTQQAGTTNYSFPVGYTGDGGPATQAQLSWPMGVAFDASGRMFIADSGYGRIRMVDTDGVISTVAGQVRMTDDGKATHLDDGDALNWVTLPNLRTVTFDNDGNLLFSDGDSGHVRKLWFQWEE
ncbi:MAG TPA: hypothetical protein V6D47_01225 [Oscillatoriaceae cyanobacterium]